MLILFILSIVLLLSIFFHELYTCFQIELLIPSPTKIFGIFRKVIFCEIDTAYLCNSNTHVSRYGLHQTLSKRFLRSR